jgi:hypothetical protein
MVSDQKHLAEQNVINTSLMTLEYPSSQTSILNHHRLLQASSNFFFQIHTVRFHPQVQDIPVLHSLIIQQLSQ